jgi:TPR repeat protein
MSERGARMFDRMESIDRTTLMRCAGPARMLRLAFVLVPLVLLAQPGRAGPLNLASLQQAAAGGDATAEFQLGTLDYVGIGVIQDYIGAADLLKQAALAGNAEAQCELGFLYQTGSFAQGPPPPDPNDALPWYQKSAALGDPYGEFALAAMLQNGQSVAADPVKAAALFAAAAQQGVKADPASFPLQQLQEHFYSIAYKLTGQTHWVDLVSIAAGGGQ